MDHIKDMEMHTAQVEDRLGLKFNDKRLLFSAFLHKSYLNETADIDIEDNERLEFLGDSVLGLIVAAFLFHNFNLSEGDLSSYKSLVVDASSCASYMRRLKLDNHIFLSRGEKRSDRGKESILANAFEAILGAIFIEKGFQGASDFFLEHFEAEIKEKLKSPAVNYKAKLQDYAQRRFQKQPAYKVMDESGPGHQKQFKVAVYIGDDLLAQGEGSSKKEAEAQAAREACHQIGEVK